MNEARDYERALRPLLSQAGGYAYAMLRRRADAEDAVQQAALKGWERRHQYDAARPFKGWWFAILRNCCLDGLRRRSVTDHLALDAHEPAAPATHDETQWQGLDEGLRRLSSAHQEILRLKYFGELSYDEIAEALGIPKGTVMSRLHLARKALAGHVAEETP